MDALSYEYLIRAVYKCGRTYKFGANADIYRGLERASVPSPGQESVDQYALGVKVGEVAAYLYGALLDILDQYNDNNGKNGQIDPFATEENDPLKLG